MSRGESGAAAQMAVRVPTGPAVLGGEHEHPCESHREALTEIRK